MKITKLEECGYEWSALGFSLSYNSTIERAKEIMPEYAFKQNGENKFLRFIFTWWDIDASRFFWQEMDTYKIGRADLFDGQSESTMHTILKRNLMQEDFEKPIPESWLLDLNGWIEVKDFYTIKNNLPEGFLQRKIIVMNYATIQNIYYSRKDHRLPQWKEFCNKMLLLDHPEFIDKNYTGE